MKFEFDSKFKIQNSKFLFILIFAFAFLAITPHFAHAATLYFSPTSGSYNVGSAFSVNVYVSSPEQAMNAASGIISFPADQLEAVSLSKSGSIMSLWVQEPSFSNAAGTVNFEGIVLNPGFTGSGGKIITINFKVEGGGNASLALPSGSVLANDGKGTNILTSLGSAQFSLESITKPPAQNLPEERPVPTPAVSSAVAGVPSALQISSPTHPDPDKWYNLRDIEFKWSLPKGITATRLLLDKNPKSRPTVTYDEALDSKKIADVEDGAWYFHVRLRNDAGWGETAHFRFQIDTRPPEPFSIKFVDSKETDNPQPTALFNTTDSLSGIAYYKVKIGEGDYFDLEPKIIASNPYILPPQAPGRRTLIVQAFDKAGNYTSALEEFVIKSIKAPTIMEYSSKITKGESSFIKGYTYPETTVTAWFEKKGSLVFEKPLSLEVKSDKEGNFMLIIDKDFNTGNYKVWLEVADKKGAKSPPTEKIDISVAAPAFLRVGITLMTLLSVIIPVAALFFLLLFLIWYGLHRFRLFKKRLKKETREVEMVLHRAFDRLREDIREQVQTLEKVKSQRELTKEEEKILKQFKKHFDDAEKSIKKEVDDIEKEIK